MTDSNACTSRHALAAASLFAGFALSLPAAAENLYSLVNIGMPAGADSAIGVRMNNLGHIAGWSIYYGQGEPSLRGWVWTPEAGFTVLDSPPDMFLGRFRAMDINDDGVVAGDGGFDSGIAWRLVDGVYETFGQIDGMPIAYLGGINNAGDVAGTSKDAQITTPDKAFLHLMDGTTINITPIGGSRATDVNNIGQVCGYMQGLHAYRWSANGGTQMLGDAGLAYSFASAVNDLGQVVGTAQSATGNTVKAWVYSDELGQQLIPAPVGSGAININNLGHVVGNTTPGSGPSYGWLWTPQAGYRTIFELYDYVADGLSGVDAHDINDAGQILAFGYDNNSGEFRTLLLTPIDGGMGACCLGETGCTAGIAADACAALGGVFLGPGTACASCIPVGACCLSDGSCVEFLNEAECAALAGQFQGGDTSCLTASCTPFLANDNCEDALPIELGDTVFSTLGATTDGPVLPASCSEPAGLFLGMDIWYAFEPTGDGVLTVSTCQQADFNTRLAAYTGTCGALQIAGCNDNYPGCLYPNTSIMEVPVTCGDPVLIRVGSFSVYTGTGALTLSFEGAACAIPGDVNGDGVVDGTDIGVLLGGWGDCASGSPCPGDLDGNGTVDGSDLGILLANWG